MITRDRWSTWLEVGNWYRPTRNEPIELRRTADVSADVLKSYAGTYALSLLFAITITVEDGKLMAQATGQEKYQIFPASESKFFYKVVDAQITFEKNKDGKVTKLVLHQNGRDMPGIRVPEFKVPGNH